jgi:hypothetical protein
MGVLYLEWQGMQGEGKRIPKNFSGLPRAWARIRWWRWGERSWVEDIPKQEPERNEREKNGDPEQDIHPTDENHQTVDDETHDENDGESEDEEDEGETEELHEEFVETIEEGGGGVLHRSMISRRITKAERRKRINMGTF